MSEQPPEYDDGRPAPLAPPPVGVAQIPFAKTFAGDDGDALDAWRRAVAEAVDRLVAEGVFLPGDTLALSGEIGQTGRVMDRGDYRQVVVNGVVGFARVEVMRPAAAPPCGCYTCRMLAEVWDNPADAEYDNL
jgi:hypothetical protein